MNDDFLNRLRVEPPPDFLARLKSRLDLQPPPTTPVARGSTLKKALLGLLLTGSVFAITLMILSRGEPDAPVAKIDKEPVTAQQPTVSNSTPETLSPPARKSTEAKPVPDVRPTTLTPFTFSYATTKTLEPYLRSLFPNGRAQTIVTVESTADAITQLCAPHKELPTLFYALVPGRATQSELDGCNRNGKPSETLVGHQVVVLARSKLYGTFSLTPTEIFLALSAEIPDPTQPTKLIPNPNTTWSDINSSFEREPIEFFGPEPSSPVGVAFREILFESGCRSLPALTEAKKCPDLRKDGVYTEAAATIGDIVLKLTTKPNAIGILPLGFAFRNTNELTASPIRGVVPTTETIANGTYPGSRPLYVYFNPDDRLPTPRIRIGKAFQSFEAEQYAVIPLELSQP